MYAHTFTGKIGFLDGISHPVLGFDHFLAMVSVGIISSQFGKRLIWTIPSVFVLVMIIGGIFGISFEFYTKESFQNMILNTQLSGVLTNYCIKDGSFYYVINYDDVSGSTSSVTSGSKTGERVINIFNRILVKNTFIEPLIYRSK